MDAISTYSEARNEYLKQLSTWIVPFMIQHYRNLWIEAKKVGGDRREMVVFQEKCAEVPKWNQDIIDTNINKLLESCRCDYLEELMAAVFIAHTKVLISIRVSSKHKKLQITLPKLDHFLHRVFSECARSFWKSPFLFLDDQKPIDMQKNLIQAEVLCSESIASAVRSLLPIKNILNEYLSDDAMSGEAIIEDSDDVKKGGDGLSPTKTKNEPLAEPVTESIAEPVAESMTEPVAEPVTESMAESMAESMTESMTESITEPVTEPLVHSVSEPVAGPVVEPVAEPMVHSESVSESVYEPIVEPEEIVIDTEPHQVHFSDYDNVFDQHSEQVGTFAYNPKSDDIDDDTPHLRIMESTESILDADDLVTHLEPSGIMEADEILE